MNIIITESQYKYILLEESTNSIGKTLKELKTFTSRVLKSTEKQIGLDLEFLITWGTTIGGFIKPISDFIKDESINISDTDLFLILSGIILTYFSSNKEYLNKVLLKIKENGLVGVFDKVLSKTENLEKAFLSFIDSLGVSIHKSSNMLAYAFLIPIIPNLYEMSSRSLNPNELNEMVKRIMSFGGISLSGVLIKELIQGIVKRFSLIK
jgi:hypothetical protein